MFLIKYLTIDTVRTWLKLGPSRPAEILIHAFVLARLDHCIALFSVLTHESTESLQMVQNAAARVLTHTRK